MRLEVTRKSELALRAIRLLAQGGGIRKGVALASAIGTTPAFLTQALSPLVHTGTLLSLPGPQGGYRLAPGTRDLSVLDVIESIEGTTDADRCVLTDGGCAAADGADPCALHAAWLSARTALLRELAALPAVGGGAPRAGRPARRRVARGQSPAERAKRHARITRRDRRTT